MNLTGLRDERCPVLSDLPEWASLVSLRGAIPGMKITMMASSFSIENAQTLILEAIKQKNPSIEPGQSFDWLVVNTKLRHTITTDEFCSAMAELGAAGLIGADESRRQFILTEKGFEAL